MGAVLALAVVAVAVAGRGWLRAGADRQVAAPARTDAAPHDAEAGECSPIEDDWALVLAELAGLDPEPVDAPSGVAAACMAAEKTLAGFAEGPQRLPRRPQLLPQLLGTLNDEAATARQIAALIGRDPALAATLVRMANSPAYRVRQAPVESIERAVALIGTDGLRGLVAVALMQPVMRTEGGVLGPLPGLIWDHVQHAAVAAEGLAKTEGEDPFAAQLLVLLQGLGAIVVVQTLRDACQHAGTPAPAAGTTAGLLRRWSPRIAGLLAQQWELSPRVRQALVPDGTPTGAPGTLSQVLARSGAQAAARMRQATANA